MEDKKGIKKQVTLPFSEAVKISLGNIRIRFWRSMITMAGVMLGIAFLVSVLTSGIILKAVGENVDDASIGARQIWLIIMSLLVCGVGITNSMLMSVTERYREIGTMKCLGALNGFIIELFMLESFFQGLFGSVIGALFGFLIVFITNLFKYGWNIILKISYISIIEYIFLAIFIGMILAIIGAIYPAYRAAKMPPAEAMRVEI